MSISAVRAVVLVVQGAGENAHAVDQALADALGQALGAGFHVVFPRLPGEDDPDGEAWKQAIAAEVRRSGAAVVVAHSVGATNTADLLAEGRYGAELPRLRGLFLLAPPFAGPGGWNLPGFHFDHATSRQSLDGLAIHFYFGTADQTVPPTHAGLYEQAFPDAVFHRIAGADHQFNGQIGRVADDIRALVMPPS